MSIEYKRCGGVNKRGYGCQAWTRNPSGFCHSHAEQQAAPKVRRDPAKLNDRDLRRVVFMGIPTACREPPWGW